MFSRRNAFFRRCHCYLFFVILVDILICYCYNCCCYLHVYHTNKVDNIQKDRRFDGITRVLRSRLTQIYLCVYIHTHTHTRTLPLTHTHTRTLPLTHTPMYMMTGCIVGSRATVITICTSFVAPCLP